MNKSIKPISSEDTETNMAKTGSPEKVSAELEKGGKRKQKGNVEINTAGSSGKQAEVPESLTCHSWKQVFVDDDSQLLCCDRCEMWFCIKCANISGLGHKFLSSPKGAHTAWYC